MRLLIDHRMKTRCSTNGPFSIDHATHLMLTIGKNMDILHTKHDIVHMDLKAFNVLVQKKFSHEGMIQDALDVLVQKRKHSYGDMFQDEVMFKDDELLELVVANFESSRLVMGTLT